MLTFGSFFWASGGIQYRSLPSIMFLMFKKSFEFSCIKRIFTNIWILPLKNRQLLQSFKIDIFRENEILNVFFNGFKSSYAVSTLEKRRKNKVETNAMQHTVRGFVHFQSSRGRGKEILTSPISIEVGREERTKPTEKASIEQPARHTNQACQPRKPSWPRKNKFQWGHFYT